MLIAFAALPGAEPPAAPGNRDATTGRLIRQPILWYCGGIQFTRLALASATAAWFPTLLATDKHLSLGTVGTVMAIGTVLTAPANLLGGYVSDRLHRPVTIIASSLTIIAATMLLLPGAHALPLIIVLVAVNQFFLQIYFGPLFEIPMRLLPPQLAGRSAGFSNMFANVGALTATFTLGTIKDHTGSFTTGLMLLAGLCLATLALTWRIHRLLQRGGSTAAAGQTTTGPGR